MLGLAKWECWSSALVQWLSWPGFRHPRKLKRKKGKRKKERKKERKKASLLPFASAPLTVSQVAVFAVCACCLASDRFVCAWIILFTIYQVHWSMICFTAVELEKLLERHPGHNFDGRCFNGQPGPMVFFLPEGGGTISTGLHKCSFFLFWLFFLFCTDAS